MFTVLICGFTCVLPLILCTQIKLLHEYFLSREWLDACGLCVCVSFSHGGRRLDHTKCVYVCVCVSLESVCIVVAYGLRAYLCVCCVAESISTSHIKSGDK